MSDLIDERNRVAELFAGLRGARIDRLGMLSDIQREPVWQHLRALNCEVKWVKEADIEAFKAAGWAPVVNRAASVGSIYMDRAGTQLLMFKSPPQSPAEE